MSEWLIEHAPSPWVQTVFSLVVAVAVGYPFLVWRYRRTFAKWRREDAAIRAKERARPAPSPRLVDHQG